MLVIPKVLIIKIVNLGGDADTIGAITGGLAGAYYGYDAIPQRWIEAIPADIRERLDAFAKWVVRRPISEDKPFTLKTFAY